MVWMFGKELYGRSCWIEMGVGGVGRLGRLGFGEGGLFVL